MRKLPSKAEYYHAEKVLGVGMASRKENGQRKAKSFFAGAFVINPQSTRYCTSKGQMIRNTSTSTIYYLRKCIQISLLPLQRLFLPY
jgi:hypothetical protein